MKEVKSPKKPLIYYYGLVMLIILLFNLFISPLLGGKKTCGRTNRRFQKRGGHDQKLRLRAHRDGRMQHDDKRID